MIVVTGATGNTGSVVAATLLDAGQDVTVVVRSAKKAEPWKSRGARVVEASFNDAKSLAAAFQGASGAYLMLPPSVDAADYMGERAAMASAFAAAAADAHLGHAVFLSSFGAQHDAGTGAVLALAKAEKTLSVIPRLTALRASWFLENFLSGIPAAQAEGVLYEFIAPGVSVPMIATRDIGAAAAEILLHPPAESGVIEITGPEDYTPERIASEIGVVLGREVRYQHLPSEAAIGMLQQFGASPDAARLMAELLDAVNKGLLTPIGRPRRMGITAREFFSSRAANAAAHAAN
jgi:uncharacterized protein YbjT (DUF2867 family)